MGISKENINYYLQSVYKGFVAGMFAGFLYFVLKGGSDQFLLALPLGGFYGAILTPFVAWLVKPKVEREDNKFKKNRKVVGVR